MSRRTVLRTALAGGVAAAAGGAAATPAAAQAGLEEWFDNTSNYDGVVDRTGQSSVGVSVGVQANGGAFGFGPAAVRVDPGTTVTWEWTGEGGSHNVVAKGGAFESEMVSDEGHTFEHTFEEEGVVEYSCTPHEAMGMKGAVVVGDVSVGGDGSGNGDDSGDGDGEGSTDTSSGEGDESTAASNDDGAGAAAGGDGGGGGGGGGGDAPAWLLFGGGVGAALSPLVFGLLVLLLGDDGDERRRTGGGYRPDGGRNGGAGRPQERR